MFGGLGNSQSDTSNRFSYSDSRLAASDNARIQDIRAGGKNSRILAATAPYTVVGTGNTVTFTDGGAFDLIGRIVGIQSGALSHVSAAGLEAIAGANDQLAALAETKVTDGANLNQKTSMTALAVLALIAVALFFFLRKAP
jgi:hypothetical protein